MLNLRQVYSFGVKKMRKISLSKKDKSINPKVKIVLIILAFLLTALGVAVFVFLETYHIYNTNIVKPTCEANGYTESVCTICKKINRTHYTEALGHNFGELKVKSEPTDLEFGENYQQCSRCNKQKVTRTDPTIDFKKLCFSGDAFTINADREASGIVSYTNKGNKQNYFVCLHYTDDDNSRYIKHDYEISFFADKKHTQEVKVALMEGKPAAHTWRLYGNYHDFYNVRETVVAELFSDIRKTSKAIDERLKKSYLLPKSEPILFFMNSSLVGVFRLEELDGLQTLNVKETDKMTAIVRATYNSSQSYFKAEITDVGPWKIKYNFTDDDQWIYDSLNELQTFIEFAEDNEFKKDISKYLDVDGMIDYMLVVYNTAAADNVARRLTLGTYDGKVWTPSFYNAKASFGLDNDGNITLLENVLAPEFKITDKVEITADTNSLLFERMLNCFYDEIKERYNKLKDTAFSANNIKQKFKKHINAVPQGVYDLEKEKYPLVDSTTNLDEFLEEFMNSRKTNLETFFANQKPKIKQQETTLN